MTYELSELEHRLIDLIEARLTEQRPAPTYEEMRQALALSSKDYVSRLLDGLEDKGYVERRRGRSRSIFLHRTSDGQPFYLRRTVRVPLIGLAPASFGIDTFDGFDPDSYIELTRDLIPDDSGMYALRVSGDSMTDAHINDGDVVVLRQQRQANNGDLVQVWLESEETATLKRWYREGNVIRLQPENTAFEPRRVPERDVRVQGKVVLVVRSLEQRLAA